MKTKFLHFFGFQMQVQHPLVITSHDVMSHQIDPISVDKVPYIGVHKALKMWDGHKLHHKLVFKSIIKLSIFGYIWDDQRPTTSKPGSQIAHQVALATSWPPPRGLPRRPLALGPDRCPPATSGPGRGKKRFL